MATADIIETDTIGQDSQGNLVQALVAESGATHVVTYTTTTRTELAFQDDTRAITIRCSALAYIKFGDGTVLATNTGGVRPTNGFDHVQPANSLVTYVRRDMANTHVAVYDGSS